MEKDYEIVLSGTQISKQFYGNLVLNHVTIKCKKGNILALVGENGAGKSTLMNIISGSLQPDEGHIEFNGNKIVFTNPHQARLLGIAFVHQELSLFDNMTVGENIMIGQEPKIIKTLIDSNRLHIRAKAIMDDLGYHVPADKLVIDLTPAQKQMVEIAKAWASKPKVLILDEPTSSLNKAEADNLFRFITAIKKTGVSVVLITHRLEEIFICCDDIIILKDGEMMAEEEVSKMTKDTIICKMVGREITSAYPPKCSDLSKENLLVLQNASLKDSLNNINLEVPKGSVIGVGGLEGQGQRELARALFGIVPFSTGTYHFDGRLVKIRSPKTAMKYKIAFVSDDRKLEGLVLPLSVQENIAMLVLKELSMKGILKKSLLVKCAKDGIKSLRIKVQSPKQPVSSLSGGNQQKIVFSKWLKFKPELLILHEPTRGIDVQSKLEIYDLIRELTAKGISVLLFTSDMLELIGMSDRIYVLYEGRVSGCLSGETASEESIMQLSAGQKKEIKSGEVWHA